MVFSQTMVEQFVRLAQEDAAQAIAEGNAPFGAILTDEQGNVVARAHNTQVSTGDPTAHSEINLLRAIVRQLHRLTFEDYHLFSNAEPCSMCMSACIKAKVLHIYFGAPHESHLDPYLPAQQVAAASREEIHLYPDVLKESCVQQIAEARKHQPPTD
jgi:tRNA(adenine34) deaminase